MSVMLVDDVFIAGTGAAFPPPVSVAAAIAAGLYDRRRAAQSEQLTVTVGDPTQPSAAFAVAAARQAIARSGHAASEIGLAILASSRNAEIDMWSPSSYWAREIGGFDPRCLPSELHNGCAGGLIGIEWGCEFLATHAEWQSAIVGASGSWPGTVLDRWRAFPGGVFADGGGAIVLSRDHGFARVLGVATQSDPGLEGLHRGDEDFDGTAKYPVDFERRAEQFAKHLAKREVGRRMRARLRAAVDEVTSKSGVSLDHVSHVVYGFGGRQQLERECLEPLGLSITKTPSTFAERVGHVGAADPLAGLNYLAETNLLNVGSHVLLIGVGIGIVWATALVQIVAAPPTGSTDVDTTRVRG